MNVTGTTKLLATFGNPNIGNPAPAIYNTALVEAGVDAVYIAAEPDDIGAAMKAVRALKLGGGTITKPFKQTVMEHLDEIDDDVKAIGATNVVINRDGKLIGRNSDWLGAAGALREVIDPKDKRVALLGAGNAARAVVYALRSLNAKTTVFNRTEDKATTLCSDFNCEYGGNLGAITPDFDVIINATSVGMGSETGPTPITAEAIKNNPAVFDIIAHPKQTALLQLAADSGCQTIQGRSMIAHLAVPTLEWLTGARASLSHMLELFNQS